MRPTKGTTEDRVRFGRLLMGLTLVMLFAAEFGCALPTRLAGVLVRDRLASSEEARVVQITREGERLTTQLDMTLKPGDEIETDHRSSAIIAFPEGSEVILRPNTHIRILNPSILVYIGEVFTKVKGFFSVETEYAAAGAEGTEFLLTVGQGGAVSVVVLDGRVALRSKTGRWGAVSLTEFQQATIEGQGAPLTKTVDRDELNRIIRWVNEVERVKERTEPRVLVPDVVGLKEEKAARILAEEQMGVGKKTGRITGGAPSGTIVGQRPTAGTRVSPGSRIDLQIEVEPVKVPSLIRKHVEEAMTILRRHRLSLGRVDRQITGKFPNETVIEQKPRGGMVVPVGTVVHLKVEAESVVVPSLERLHIDRAMDLLQRAGLQRGQVREEMTGRYEPGMVLDQRPPPGQRVLPGTAVDLIVEAESAVVPNVVRMHVNQADGTLRSARLRLGQVREEMTGRYEPGAVLDQRPPPGQRVLPGTAVDLVVEAESAVVPNVVGLHIDEARAVLKNARLVPGQERTQITRDDVVREGGVLEQHPSPGTRVRAGQRVDLVIAVRPRILIPTRRIPEGGRTTPQQPEKICQVPEVRRLMLKEALDRLDRAGLSGRVSQQYGYDRERVYNQSPAPGSRVPCGSQVDLVVGTIG